MPLLSIKLSNGIIETKNEIALTSFKDLSLKESDIEEFIRKNISSIFEDETILIVGRQVRNDKNGICDLVALDANGNIVLIEVKRDEEDMKARREAFEFQAIRYAASFANICSIDEIVDKIFVHYINKYSSEYDTKELTARERGMRILQEFLEKNQSLKNFNTKQRIILMASSFDDQTLSAVAWLIKNGVDISCLQLQPLKMGNELLLDIERVLPPISLDNYFSDIESVRRISRVDALTGDDQGLTKRYYPRMPELFAKGIIKKGDELSIKGFGEESKATAYSEKLVEYKEKKISYNEWGQKVTGWSAIQIYTWAILERDTLKRTLHELRTKINEEETQS